MGLSFSALGAIEGRLGRLEDQMGVISSQLAQLIQLQTPA